MAVAEVVQSTLQLVFLTGYEQGSGEPTYKTKSFTNVKPNATATQLNQIADAFQSLQQHDLYEVFRRDVSEIRTSLTTVSEYDE